MEPYAHTATADELDEMAEKLGRLNSRGSGYSRHTQSVSSVDERYDGRRRVPSSGSMSLSHAPDSPRYPGQDDVFRLPTYEIGDRPAAAGPMQPPGTPRAYPQFHRKDSYSSERRPSRGSTAGYSLYPAPKPPMTKPLPPVPALALGRQTSRRASSQPSLDGSEAGSGETSSRYSQSSSRGSTLERVSSTGSATASTPAAPLSSPTTPGEFRAPLRPVRPPQQPMQPQHPSSSQVTLVPWKQLVSNDKPLKEPSVYFFDISTTSATLASKHGNNIVRIWSVGSGEVQNNLKISCYTTAQARSREYFVRSHAILSEPSNLIAIATGFGDTLEIWDWGKKKRLQTFDNANRWAAVRSNVMEAGWCSLVTYNGDADTIDLYAPTRNAKKPFKKARTIELRKAGLPVLPKYPELAFSATGPLLVTASGPRPPRLGHPPPERETLLTAWEVHDGAATATPYKVVAPWQHSELDTALPSGLATYGSVAVSIWIPASYRAVPIPAERGGTGGYNLAPVAVPYRHVLVWDFAASSTRTFRIPNTSSCVSPDCRFVAYCDARGVESGARGCLALLDAMTGRQLWCWPDPDAGVMDDAVQNHLPDLSKVSEMCFSADGGFLFVGDLDGGIAVFEVREGSGGAAGSGASLRGVR
ncbi:uncharacterized protein THITE_63059 [Thermothielavioides terrestris NRRL 8126]|uniref:Uncharacterized protein n=1 Tax=Thermothielavioides terrestris (strain ATCC 38088 / NRRL 8126) TaxID=578455 RepID=G2QT49_THETT|nr:uncharacterized protein THITE_63059 [Thermothielavioides terrestris NRRL 8126]AEO64375.1 hypothetical protein THITE_63059 [Thermothielavioides terrestris NRRL 8126]